MRYLFLVLALFVAQIGYSQDVVIHPTYVQPNVQVVQVQPVPVFVPQYYTVVVPQPQPVVYVQPVNYVWTYPAYPVQVINVHQPRRGCFGIFKY